MKPIPKENEEIQRIDKDPSKACLTSRTNLAVSALIEDVSRSLISDEQAIDKSHHANHALYYLGFIVYSIIKGRNDLISDAMVQKIVCHLSRLREIVTQQDAPLLLVIDRLLAYFRLGFPKSRRERAIFIHTNWKYIVSLSQGGFSGEFTYENYQKIEKLIEPEFEVLQKSETEDADRLVFFKSLTSNLLGAIVMKIMRIIECKSPGKYEESNAQILFFLDLMNRYYRSSYMDNEIIWDACAYLVYYFESYSNAKIDEAQTALQKVLQLYHVLGLEIPIQEVRSYQASLTSKTKMADSNKGMAHATD